MEKADLAPDEAHFFLAVCSQQPLYGSPAFVYLPSSANVLRERERHIGLLQEHLGILQGEVKKRDEWLEAARVELDKFEEVQERSRNTIAQLEQDNADKEKWAHELEQEIKDVQADRRKCMTCSTMPKDRVDDAEKRVIERTEWAWRLDRELEEARRNRKRRGRT